MNNLLDIAAKLMGQANDLEGRAREGKLKEALSTLEGAVPCGERDGLIALAYLRLHQYYISIPKLANEAERTLMLGHSYARTSKQEQVYRLAEKLSTEAEAKQRNKQVQP